MDFSYFKTALPELLKQTEFEEPEPHNFKVADWNFVSKETLAVKSSFAVVDRTKVNKPVKKYKPKPKQFTKAPQQTQAKRRREPANVIRESSIKITSAFKLLDQISFSRLSKLNYEVAAPEELYVTFCSNDDPFTLIFHD